MEVPLSCWEMDLACLEQPGLCMNHRGLGISQGQHREVLGHLIHSHTKNLLKVSYSHFSPP